MEKILERLRGTARVTISGAEPRRFLNICAERGVVLRDCSCINSTLICCTVSRRSFAAAEKCAEAAGCSMCVEVQKGGGYLLKNLNRRYVLMLGALFVMLLLGFSGLFVWDIDVEGNVTVPTHEILAALDECGVKIGSNWTAFNGDMISSGVLYRIPALSYISVTVSGSRAKVQVRERVQVPDMDYDTRFSNIAAAKNAVIKEIRPFRGHPLAAAGDTVAQGQVLVSGKVPGIELWEKPVEYRYVSALAEVVGETEYEFTAFLPLAVNEKQYTGREAKNFALIIGEKRLNFYKNTGIYRSSCDTIYYVWKFEVPGLFSLPLSVVCESRMQYELSTMELNIEEREDELKDELLYRLHQELSDEGELISAEFAVREADDGVYVTLKARCLENIAQKIPMDDYPMEEEEDT